jgi:hypothetical protein
MQRIIRKIREPRYQTRQAFVLFLLAIVLSVLIPYTDSDYLPLVSSNSSYLILISDFEYDLLSRYA